MYCPHYLIVAAAAVLSVVPVRLRALEVTEILTENEGGLEDADGNTPGWIELRNETGAAVSLAGWRLTDDAAVPGKWALPGVSLAAGARVVVFVSGKDRAVAGQELHANFRLDPDGEYLALMRPDGTVAQAFAPVPQLRRNVSYSETAEATVVSVLGAGSGLRWRVPQAGDAEGWQAAGFDAAAWTAGVSGIGYDAVPGGDLLRVDWNDRDNNTVANTEGGFQSFVIGATGGSGAVQTGTVSRTLGAYTVSLTNLGVDGYDDRLRTTPVNSGSFTQSALLRDVVFSRDQTGNGGLEVVMSGFPPLLPCRCTVWSYDSGGPGARVSDWTANGVLVRDNYTFNGSSLPVTNEASQFSFDVVSDAAGRIAVQGRRDASSTAIGVFLNGMAVSAASYAPHIGSVTSVMRNVNASVRMRAPFVVSHAGAVEALRLRVRYDDGFAAWVNGVPLVTRNAPAVLGWNAAATRGRSRSEALVPEEIMVPVPAGMLVNGVNVLAVQVCNESAGDGDLLFAPEVEVMSRAVVQPRYYAVPTPGLPNATPFAGLVADTEFTADRGFYTNPFQVTMTSGTAGAVIRYTLDGSEPTAGSGSVYGGPLTVTGTTVLRAAAFLPGWIPSNVDTQTYVFVDQVVRQPANPVGWPATWGMNAEVDTNDGAGNGTVPGDYEMDPAVTGVAAPVGYTVEEALRALPTISLTMAPGDFLGANGIYQNPQSIGAAWERRCSIEFMDPTGREGRFAETCIVEVHGNSSRRPWRMQKHSLRLSFRGEVGAAKLRQPVFPGSRVTSFDKLVLRASFTDSWGLVSWDPGRYRPDDSVYFRDVWMRRAHEAMGSLSADSRWVHLYINGLYWGCHNLCERVEDEFVASHEGGEARDYEVVDDFVDPDPSATSRWKTMFGLMTSAGSLVSAAAYENVKAYVDVAQFADYYLLHVFADCEDWPHHNGYAWRRRAGGDLRYRFGVWDQEIMLDNAAMDRFSAAAGNTGTDRTAGRLYQRLRENAEWRLLFADRVRKHLFNGGALTLERSQGRWQSAADELDRGIVAESARWGDTADATPYGNTESRPGVPLKAVYTRAADWLPSVAAVKNSYLPAKFNVGNSQSVFSKLRSVGLWPATAAPEFGKFGGVVPSGYGLTMTGAGSIYYTLDGSDPREAVSGNARGILYGGPVVLTGTVVVRARVRNGAEWSPVTEAQFVVGTAASAANTVVSRLHYNPPEGGEREYLEVMNISGGPVELTDAAFTAGIAYRFPAGAVLGAGERMVLVADAAVFAAAWPGVVVGGVYAGRLDNTGEAIALSASDGTDIRRFRYNDRLPWPEAADGGGYSLTLIAPETNPDHGNPRNWRASVRAGGVPGVDDAVRFTGVPLADANGNGRADLVDYAVSGELAATLVAGGEGRVAFVRNVGADDARVTVETSVNLAEWVEEPLTELVAVTVPVGGRQEETWRLPMGQRFARVRVSRR
ncbi:MAG: CotH protein/Chitobiase/beta-hexosaminidase C-terminal domain-containing protein/Lamin Tail Domain [Verrucomicrobia bacterium]|nr:MAG: CotH protein/Chitobiase/beta-hexosaminidase C-terminal domain-containing protein/Lamin Tail Domain [Verrucomicrobiota bacterium]